MLPPETGRMILDSATGEPEGKSPHIADAITELHTRTVDALRGYEKMVEKAEPEFRATAQKFRDLHDSHASALSRILIAMGAQVDADGSFMGTVNQAVVSLRAFFDEIDEDVMDNIRSGEDHVLKAFDGALASGAMPQDHETSLLAMREELLALLTATRHLD
ncbi:MAG: DUF2383 domain-containing protein [Paracoccaceae bacterium]